MISIKSKFVSAFVGSAVLLTGNLWAIPETKLQDNLTEIPPKTVIKPRKLIETKANSDSTPLNVIKDQQELKCYLSHPNENKVLQFPESLSLNITSVKNEDGRNPQTSMYLETAKGRTFKLSCSQEVRVSPLNGAGYGIPTTLAHLDSLFQMAFPDSPVVEVVE